jgi:hypothetical protein
MGSPTYFTVRLKYKSWLKTFSACKTNNKAPTYISRGKRLEAVNFHLSTEDIFVEVIKALFGRMVFLGDVLVCKSRTTKLYQPILLFLTGPECI